MTAPEILQNIKKLLALANEEIDKLLTLLGDENVRTMDQYLTRKEAAFFLEVSPRTLDRRCEEGVILREEVNGRILIRKSELLKYRDMCSRIQNSSSRVWSVRTRHDNKAI